MEHLLNLSSQQTNPYVWRKMSKHEQEWLTGPFLWEGTGWSRTVNGILNALWNQDGKRERKWAWSGIRMVFV